MRHQRERENKIQSNPDVRIPEGAGTPLPRRMGLCPSSGCSREGIPAQGIPFPLFLGKTQLEAGSALPTGGTGAVPGTSRIIHCSCSVWETSSTRIGWGYFTFPESRKNLQLLEALPWDSQQHLLHWFEPFPDFQDPQDAVFFQGI